MTTYKTQDECWASSLTGSDICVCSAEPRVWSGPGVMTAQLLQILHLS